VALSEEETFDQFQALRARVGANEIERLPIELKDMIHWAEAEKKKRGMN